MTSLLKYRSPFVILDIFPSSMNWNGINGIIILYESCKYIMNNIIHYFYYVVLKRTAYFYR